MEFDKSFEEAVLAAAMKDPLYLKKAARILDSHHFNTPVHGWIWAACKHTWDTYRERPTKKLLLHKAKADFGKKEKREPYTDLVRRLSKKTPTAASATLEELSKFVRSVNAQIAMEAAATELEKGDVDKVYQTLKVLSTQDLRPREYSRIKWIEEFDERQAERKYMAEHPDEYKRVPTGFKRLDKIMGGLEVSEIGLILATTGKGKSIMLNNLAFNGIKTGFKVAYFALEMPARQVAARQDALWLGMPYKKFKDYDFAPSELREIEAKKKRMAKKWKDTFQIASFPLGRCDVQMVRGALDDWYQEDGFRPDMLCIDSGDHMKSMGRAESYRLEQASVYRDLKALAEEDGYAIWSSTHAGREWATSTATAEATGESYDKARLADVVISLNTPESASRSTKVMLDSDSDEDEEDFSSMVAGKLIEMHLAKYRDGESKLTIPLDADFSRMVYHEIGE